MVISPGWPPYLVQKLHAQSKRFFAYVDKAGPGGCWVWTGACMTQGYGQFSIQNRKLAAHRVSWVLAGKVLNPRQVLHHTCMRKTCVRPDHLAQVSYRDNNFAEDRVPPEGRCDPFWWDTICIAIGRDPVW